MRRRKEKKGVKVVCECMEGGARFCCSVREHVWIMPAVIYMRGRARVRKWASMKGKDCVYVVRVCMCECVLMHVRKLWCPWLSSVYWQEMFVQAKRKKSCRPTWQTLGQGIHTRTCIDAHAGMYTRTHACKERFKKKKRKEKRGIWRALQFMWWGVVSGIGEVGVTGLGTACSLLPSTLTANTSSSR